MHSSCSLTLEEYIINELSTAGEEAEGFRYGQSNTLRQAKIPGSP